MGVTIVCAIGCSTTTIQYVPIPDTAPVASAVSPNAKVFVIRPSGFYAGGVPVHVSATGNNLKNTSIGKLANGGFLCFEQSPGELALRILTEPPGGLIAGPSSSHSITDRVAAGEVYFFRVGFPRWNSFNAFVKDVKIRKMTPFEAKKYLKKAKSPVPAD